MAKYDVRFRDGSSTTIYAKNCGVADGVLMFADSYERTTDAYGAGVWEQVHRKD